MSDINTTNKYMVTSGRGGIFMLNAPLRGSVISADEALLLAAWLVSMAEHDASHEFAEVLAAVKNT